MPSKKRANRPIPYCLISNQTNNRWFDFNLQKNHLFGEDHVGKFVVRGMDDKYIYLYRATLNVPGAPNFNPRPSLRGAHIWTSCRIRRDTMTGKLILRTHAETGAKPVEYKETYKLCRELYHPRDTIWDQPFTPVPNMRIPGGAYERKTKIKYTEAQRRLDNV